MTLTPGKLILNQSPEVLYDSNESPSLDLRFAENKTLDDYVSGTPLVDHQRSMSGSNLSPGTFVNSNGLVETAKVNALTANSEVFSGWPIPSTSTQTTTSPFNTTAASVDSATALSISVNDSSAVTFSGYFKQGSSRYVYLRPVVWADNPRVWFDLQTGNFVNVSPAAAPISNAFATSVGNGWYRCGFTLDSTGDSVGNLQITATDSSTNINSVGYVFAFGIQAEEGPVSTYIPTTNLPSAAPRFDHNPTTGESLGLLVEEARTNLFDYSTDLTQWTASNSAPPVASSEIAPDGSTDAYKLNINIGGGSYFTRNVPTVTGSVYTISVWAKNVPGEQNYFDLFFNTAGSVQLGKTALTDTWTRYHITGTATQTGNVLAGINNPPDDYTARGLFWGFQFELGAFPTSYIPTTGTALTRSADVASITGTNFSSWYNQSAGSVFVETVPKNYSLADLFMFGTNKSFNPSSWGTYQPGANNDYQFYSRISSAYDFNASINNSDAASKLSFGLSGTTYSASYDGNTVTTGSNSGVPTGINTLEFNKGVYGISSIYVKRFTYYPYRLADTRLQSLTA